MAQLGKLLDGDEERDAIHVAIAPIRAAEELFPGQAVGADGRPGDDNVGIVDPFLKAPVQRGQKCYVLLFPNTITDMRHHWNHPAFPESDWESSSDYGGCSNC